MPDPENRHDGNAIDLGPRFQEALVYGAGLHRRQTRKGSAIPYVGHLLIVSGTVIEWGGNEEQAIAAVLHDAIEDQVHEGETAAEIRRALAIEWLRSWRD